MSLRSNTSSDKVDENEDLMCSAFLFCWKSESVTLSLWNGVSQLDEVAVKKESSAPWELIGLSLGVHCQVGTVAAGGLFPKGGGWVGLKYMFQFPEWDGSIFPCPLWLFLWVRTGKLNMNSCCVIWWYQIISFWSSVYFYLGWGGRVSAPRI